VPLLLFMYLLTGAIAFFDSVDNWAGMVQMWAFGGLGILAILGAIAYRMSRKFMGFVGLAEGIFQAFGWKNVRDIDLPAITKKSKTSGEPGALGVLYFRY
ncbi:putative type VI secretion system effector, partial [Paraburkholderia graminis]